MGSEHYRVSTVIDVKSSSPPRPRVLSWSFVRGSLLFVGVYLTFRLALDIWTDLSYYPRLALALGATLLLTELLSRWHRRRKACAVAPAQG